MPDAEQLTAGAELAFNIEGYWKSGFLLGRSLQIPDLFDQVGLLVVELLVLRPVVLEPAEELDELGLVLEQDVQDGLRLVRVGDKHLKNVKGLKLDVATFVSQKVHH